MERCARLALICVAAVALLLPGAARAGPFERAIDWLAAQQEAAQGFELHFDAAYEDDYRGWVSGSVEGVDELDGSRSPVPYVAFAQQYPNSHTGPVAGTWLNVADRTAYEVEVFSETDLEYSQGRFPLAVDGTWSTGTETVGAGRKIAKLVRKSDGTVVAVTGGRPNALDDYEVRVYSRSDVDYLQQTVPLYANGTWQTTRNVFPGTKIARLVRRSTGRVLNSTEWTGSPGFQGLVRSFHIPQDDPDYGYEGDATKRAGYRLEQRSFVYDDALAVLAFDKAGQTDRSRAILEQLEVHQALDGGLPFSLDVFRGQTFEDYRRSGAIAWVGYAAVDYEEHTGDPRFRTFTTQLADYLLTLQVTEANGYPASDPRYGSVLGGRGRYSPDYDYIDEPVTFASTEHNIDAYFFLRDLAALTGSAKYETAARQIEQSLLTNHWNAEEGRFNQGVGDTAHALDTASWGGLFLLAVGDRARAAQSAEYLRSFRVDGASVELSEEPESYNRTYEGAGPFSGYKPYGAGPGYETPPEVVWSEGTWGALLFRQRLGEDVSADVASMDRLQDLDPDGGVLQVTRGSRSMPYEFHVWPSVGGTAWAALVHGDGSRLWRADAPRPTVTEPSSNDAVVATATPRFAGDAGDAEGHDDFVTVRIFRWNGADWEVEREADAPRAGAAWSHTSAPLRDGTYEVEAVQSDRWNRAGESGRRRFVVATTPGVNIVQPFENQRIQGFETPISGTVGGDPGDGRKVLIRAVRLTESGPRDQWTGEAEVRDGRWSTATPMMPHGDYELTVQLSDDAGFTGTATRHFTLVPKRAVLSAEDRTTDTDRDSIPDWYEVNPYDHDGDGVPDIDLKAMGADPNRPDVFLEIDSMQNHNVEKVPWQNEVVKAFAQKHWLHGQKGVHLHIDDGYSSTMRWDTHEAWRKQSRANVLPHDLHLGTCSGPCPGYDWKAFDAIKDKHFDDARRPFFHYALSVHQVGDSTEVAGKARPAKAGEIAGSDFVIAHGFCEKAPAMECGQSTFLSKLVMHELGHNLGLRHGGGDELNFKPNYLSIMNYHLSGGVPDGSSIGKADYSHWQGSPLDERSLDERIGVLPTVDPTTYGWNFNAVKRTFYWCKKDDGLWYKAYTEIFTSTDWDCDGNGDEQGVTHDITRDGDFDLLHSWDDWSNMRFDGGEVGNLAGGPQEALPRFTSYPEPTIDQIRASRQSVQGDSAAPRVRFVGRRSGRMRLRVKVSASDNRALDHVTLQIGRRVRVFRARGTRKRMTATVTLRRGTHRVRAVAVDRAGAESRQARRTVRVRRR